MESNTSSGIVLVTQLPDENEALNLANAFGPLVQERVAEVDIAKELQTKFATAVADFFTRTATGVVDTHNDNFDVDDLNPDLITLFQRTLEQKPRAIKQRRCMMLGDSGLMAAGGMWGRGRVLTGSARDEYALNFAKIGYTGALDTLPLRSDAYEHLAVLASYLPQAAQVVADIVKPSKPASKLSNDLIGTPVDWANSPMNVARGSA